MGRNDHQQNHPQQAYQYYPQQPVQQPIIINSTDSKPRTNHLLHFIISLVTFGLWVPVWFLIRVVRGR